MNIKTRLTLMNFLQFFVWGSWLISLGGYMMGPLKFTGGQVGGVYATMGIASLFMPGTVRAYHNIQSCQLPAGADGTFSHFPK